VVESLYRVLEALSSLARTGWMLRGVPHSLAESVAEHSYWAAVLALEIASRAKNEGLEVDPYKAAAIALVHDMAEAVIGDIARVSGISRDEKRRAEERAFMSLPLSGEARELYAEFEEGRTLEARIARLAEELATLLRALFYRRLGYDVSDIERNMRKSVATLAGELGVSDIIREVSGLSNF
jgi:putative hydrolase of HD superfamily